MAATQEKTREKPTNAGNNTTPAGTDSSPNKIDRNAPAGSENSLGAESVRDGRPNTGDDVVEAIDEEGPGITPPLP